ncbi:ATP-binding protein [Oscillatoria sp. FACHB-1406]|nr:ATP-binding protein [Oscillatoria sp. FACHB-1406]
MLIEFSVGNYRSFKEIVTLSLVATNLKAKNEQVDENNVFQVDDKLSLLKNAVIYGANASGKSNLIQAFEFMKDFILNSSRETQITDEIATDKFKLSTESEAQPSFFELVFILEEKIYRYGFEIERMRVISEWLFHIPKKKETCLFNRKFNDFEMTKVFSEGKGLEEKTRKNSLFLSVAAQFNGKISQKILFWLDRETVVLSGLKSNYYQLLTTNYVLEYPKYQSDIADFLRGFDLGIEAIRIKPSLYNTIEENYNGNLTEEAKQAILASIQNSISAQLEQIKTLHLKYNDEGEVIATVTFDLDKHESEGTKKLFAFAIPFLLALQNGGVLLIDELDARIHPAIVREIVKLFNSKQSNPGNAQLIFVTHDTNLLDNELLRRDQIWFIEKDNKGASDLYSLAEFKVRNDASYKNDYLKGKYGAIPYFGQSESFNR